MARAQSIRSIAERLYPFSYSVVGEGNDAAVPAFKSLLPFALHEYDSGRELNGWRITPKCKIIKAEIRKDGRLVYDGTASPLGVIAQSDSFKGDLSLEELQKHLFTSDSHPDAIIYHWSKLYRVEEGLWGFCMPKRQYESLSRGIYHVEIVTQSTPGTMKVLDYLLPGASPRTILLNAHNCHPFQANDDISGCATAIALMQRLSELRERRFSYRLLIAPEIIGPLFWLKEDCGKPADLIGAILMKSVGNDRALRLQETFTGDTLLDRAAHHVFRNRYGTYDSGAFRTIYGNDETVFESPPYNIPSISLTRWPFNEYHTDRDTPDRLSEERLEDTVQAALDIILALERAVVLEYSGDGLVCLSHPRFDLYHRAPAPGLDKEAYSAELEQWNLLMNRLPRDLDGATDLLTIADRYDLPLEAVHRYAMSWVDKGLAQPVRSFKS